MFVLEIGAEAIAAVVKVQAEMAGVAGDGILVWVDQDTRGRSLLRSCRMWRMNMLAVSLPLAVLVDAYHWGAEVFEVFR